MITDIFMTLAFGGFIIAIFCFCHYIGFKDGQTDVRFDKKKR